MVEQVVEVFGRGKRTSEDAVGMSDGLAPFRYRYP